jgi:hypothetical protein
VTVIDAYNYRISIDAEGVESGAALTRKEMNSVRSTFRQLTDPADKITQKMTQLQKAFTQGAISERDYLQAMGQLQSQLPDVIAAEKQRAQELERGAKLTDKYQRSTEKLAKELAEIDQLERSGAIDKRTAGLARRDARMSAGPGSSPMGGMASRIPGASAFNAVSAASAAGPAAMAAVAAGAAVAGVVVALGAATVAAIKFWGAMRGQQDAVQNVYRASQALGSSVESLVGLQYAFDQNAGISSEETIAMVSKLANKTAAAASGSKEAADIFASMGLDPKALMFDDPTDVMRKVIEKAGEIENPIERARVAMKLFEEQGIKLGSVLAGGADSLAATEARARELGLTVSNFDAAKVDGAQAALTDIAKVTEGIVRQFTVSFAPAVSAIGYEIVSWLQPMTQSGDVGERVGRIVVGILGATIDVTRAAIAYHRILWNIATLDFSEAKEQMAVLKDAAGGGTTRRMLEGMEQAKRLAADATKAKQSELELTRAMASESERVKAVEAILGPMRANASGENAKSLASMQAQLQAAGATTEELAEQARLYQQIEADKRQAGIDSSLQGYEKELQMATAVAEAKIRGIDETTATQHLELQLAGASGDELRRHLELRSQIVAQQKRAADADKEAGSSQKAAADMEKMRADAQQLRDSQRTPEQALAAEFDRLRDMRRADLISDAEYNRARVEAAKKAMAAATEPPRRSGAAFGSVDEYKAIVEAQQARRRNEVERVRADEMMAAADRLAKAEDRRLVAQQQTTRELQRQAKILQDGGGGLTRGGTPGQPDIGESELVALTKRIADATELAAERIERIERVGAV